MTRFTCTRSGCGERRDYVVPATGHNFVDGACEHCDLTLISLAAASLAGLEFTIQHSCWDADEVIAHLEGRLAIILDDVGVDLVPRVQQWTVADGGDDGFYLIDPVPPPGRNNLLLTVNFEDCDCDNDTPRLRGDLNGDGRVDILDLLILMRFMDGLEPGIAFEDADINGDGVVDMRDLQALLQIIRDLETPTE
jgi:hypothetical protein